MKIVYDNVWAKLVEFSADERTWLDDYLSCEEKRYVKGRYGAPSGMEQERVRMLHVLTHQFPAGLLPMVQRAAKDEGLVVEAADQRTPPVGLVHQADVAWLRDYQRSAVIKAAIAGRGLIKAPTASGKTEMCVALTRVLPCEWLFVVHRADLTLMAADRYKLRTGEEAGVFQAGQWTKGSANFTVSTFQAIAKGLRDGAGATYRMLAAMQGVMVDECHAQPADSFYNVVMNMREAYYRIGVSGTPLDRGPKDTLRTMGALGPIVSVVQHKVLEDAGLLSKPSIFMIPCHQEGTTRAGWRETYQQFVVNSVPRNTLLADMAERAAKPALLFVDEKAQGDWLVAELQRRGLQADFVHGKHWVQLRRDMVDKLVGAKLDVLVCSVVFQEGIDIPQLASVVHGGGKKSIVGTLQRIGRGMRTAAGKDGFEVWDVWDQGQPWMQKHAMTRRGAYERNHTVHIGWPK